MGGLLGKAVAAAVGADEEIDLGALVKKVDRLDEIADALHELLEIEKKRGRAEGYWP